MNEAGKLYRRAAPLVASAIGSAVLFYSGIFAFLFAVPVQVAYTRRGTIYGAVSAATTAAVIITVHVVQVLRFESLGAEMVRVLFLDSLMPIGLLAGLSVFNVYKSRPWWTRLLAGSAVAIVATIPSLRILAQISAGDGPFADQMEALLEVVGLAGDPAMWISAVYDIVLNTIGLGVTAAIAANWWIGRGIVFRGYGIAQSLRTARVPDSLIWVVIAGLGVVTLTWLAGPEWAAPVGWNAVLIGAFLFGIQGTGLTQHLLRRRGMGVRGERWVLTIVLAMLFVPGLNVVAGIGLPLLGMSELWIDYKRGEEYEGHSEQ